MTWLKWTGIAWGAVLGLLWLGAVHIYAQAIADPDRLAIEQVTAYSGVINSGDMLVVIQYDIDYDTLPILAATDAFICRFMVDDSEVNASEIIAFNNLGYGLGVCSVYFSDLDRTAAGIEFDNPNAEDYEVQIQGKPSAFASPPTVTTLSIQYRDSTQTVPLLTADISEIANSLQNDADWLANDLTLITFTTGQQVLTSIGEAYLGQAIPNLQLMVPDLFGSSTTSPDVFERDFGTSEEDRLLSQWDASPVGPIFEGLGDELRIGKTWILALLGVGLLVLAFFIATEVSGSSAFGMLVLPFAFPLAIAAGFGPMTAVFFVTAMFVLGLMYSLFLRRAG